MKTFDVIIIGAGAAGLMTAWQAALRGRTVAILEQAKKPGRKILMSGGGRCNFTNLDVQPENYLSENPHFVKSALKRYTQWDFIAKVLEHGIPYHERKHGELFCDNSAKDILKLLLDEANSAGAKLLLQQHIQTITHNDGAFTLTTDSDVFHTHNVVIATGGLSIPSMKPSTLAYDIAKQFGMETTPLSAALVPFTFADKRLALCQSLAGNAIEVSVSCNQQQFTENMLFTHRGLSGPSMLQISSYWRQGEAISVDLIPGQHMQTVLHEFKQQSPKSLLRSKLQTFLPKSLVIELEKLWWPSHANQPLAQFGNALLDDIADHLNGWTLYPSGTEGYKTAEVTLGGVSTRDLSSKTMESKTQPGLYFVGECVDVTGHLGGYNFQWAWSSGYAAGTAV